MRASVWLAVLLSAACGDNQRDVVQVDFALGDATFAVYRDEYRDWTPVAPVASGSYVFSVGNAFELVVVYEAAGSGFYAEELAATYAEGDHWRVEATTLYGGSIVGHLPPASPFEGENVCSVFPPSQPYTVEGTMFQAGQVATAGVCAESMRPEWQYALPVPAGDHDVIATDPLGATSPRLAIARGVPAGATSVNFDLTSGVTADSATLVVANPDPSNNFASELFLYSAAGAGEVATATGVLANGTFVTPVFPAAGLAADDQQVMVFGSLSTYSADARYARLVLAGAPPTFDLLPPANVAIDSSGSSDVVTWTDAPGDRYTFVDLEVSRADAYVTQHVTATRGWLAEMGAHSLAFDTSAPGYSPAWMIDRALGYYRSVTLRDDSGVVSYTTSTSVTIPAGSVAR